MPVLDVTDTLDRRTSFGEAEPEPEEPARPEEDRSTACKHHWSIKEFEVPTDVAKMGTHFSHLPPNELVIKRITPGSWADEQGIREGDVVHAIASRRADELSIPSFLRLMGTRPLQIVIDRTSSQGQ